MNSLPMGRYSYIMDEVGNNWDIHVRVFIPRRRIKINSSAIIVDAAWTKLLKQAHHTGTSGLI